MGTNQEGTSGSGTVPEGETGVGDTVEIKIITSPAAQSYTLRVEKNVAVPALKEKLVSVVGVPAESQRLICRGKVLNDDQLLSAYNVEDGHTLHLVARHPPSTSEVGPSTASSEGGQGESGMPPSWGRPGQALESLLMRTTNFSNSGHLPDMNRIINAVISSMGMHGGGSLQGGVGNADNSNSGVSPTLGGLDGGAANGRNSGSDQETGVRELQIDALYGMPFNSAGNTGQSLIRGVLAPVVVPDALTFMSQYLDRLEQSFAAYESARTANFQESSPTEVRLATRVRPTGEEPRRGASPAALGALVNRLINFLRGQAGSAFSCLASRLSSEPTMLDTAARDDVQHAAFHDGNLMQQIGALLLELGRATMSLRMGQSPSESVVNSGPATFISSVGPNSIMVQSLLRPSAGGAVVGTGLPSTPGTLGPSPGVPRLPRSIKLHTYTINPGTFFTVPSFSFSLSPRPSSFEGHVCVPAGGSGFVVRPLRGRGGPSAGGAVVRIGLPSTFGTLGPSPGVPGLPRSIHHHTYIIIPVTFFAVRTFSSSPPPRPSSFGGHVRAPAGGSGFTEQQHLEWGGSRDAPHAGSAPNDASRHTRPTTSSTYAADGARHVHVDPLLSRFQHQSNSRTASDPPNATPATAAMYPPPRQMDQASRSLPGDGAVSESRNGEFLYLMNSLAPLLQHLAGLLQQSGAPTPPQQQFNAEPLQPPSTYTVERPAEAEVRPTDDAQPKRGSLNRESIEPESSSHPTRQGQTLEVDGSGGPRGVTLDAAITAPVGLGVGSLQAPPARVRRRRQTQQSNQDGQPQPVQETLQNLQAQRDLANDTNPRTSLSPFGQFLRAMRGAGGQQGGGGIIGQLMSSSESDRRQDASSSEDVASGGETTETDDERQQFMCPLSDIYRRSTPAAKKQKTAVESAAEKLEDGGSAEFVLRDLADAATAGISGNNETTSTEDTSQQVVRVDGLAEVRQNFPDYKQNVHAALQVRLLR